MTLEPESVWPWPAPHDDGGVRHLVPGLALPDIALPATLTTAISPTSCGAGSAGTSSPPPSGPGLGVVGVHPATSPGVISLANRPGLSVVFVYPWTGRAGLPNPPDWDQIPGAHGSTPEAEGFRDTHSELAALGTAVFGLSTQDAAHHAELAARLGLPYPLLSDTGLEFTRALGLPTFETGGVAYLKRLTLVVRDGRLVHAFYPVHPPDTHARAVLAWLASRA